MKKLHGPDRKLAPVVWALGSLLFVFPLTALAQSEIGYTAIPVSEMKRMLDSGTDILVVDTFSKSTYIKEHIPGAKNLNFRMRTWIRGIGRKQAERIRTSLSLSWARTRTGPSSSIVWMRSESAVTVEPVGPSNLVTKRFTGASRGFQLGRRPAIL